MEDILIKSENIYNENQLYAFRKETKFSLENTQRNGLFKQIRILTYLRYIMWTENYCLKVKSVNIVTFAIFYNIHLLSKS